MMKLKKLFLIICTICFAAALACGVAACSFNNGGKGELEVASISIEPSSVSVYVDESVSLKATVNPANATNKTVAWTSSKPEIAVVDDEGKVTGKAKGDAVIYASAGGKQAECKVTVKEKPYVPVNSVTFNLDKISIMVGEENSYLKTYTILPADATNRTEQWSSSNPDCVEVNNGILNAKSAGTAIITLTVDGKSAHCEVTVTGKIEIDEIKLSATSFTINLGKTATITATVKPAVSADLIVWETSDSSVATVVGGVVTARGKGTAEISATVGGKTAKCLVTVNVPVTGIYLNKETLTITLGESSTLDFTLEPLNATNQNVTWSSSDNTVATVSNGVVKALKVGTATITVTSAEGPFASCAVTVTDEPHVNVAGVSLNKNHLDLKVGESETLKATVTPSDATDPSVGWKSSDPTVATVVGGVVKALKAGTTTITATAEQQSATCTVTVTDIEVESVSLNKDNLELKVGGSGELTATVTPSNATNVEFSWSSSKPSVATVADGVVTAVAVGETTITVTVGGKSDTCLVTVIEDGTGGGGGEDENPETIITYAHKGEEMAAFEWKDANASNAKVEYKLSTASSYTRIDKELIRQKGEVARADIVGLKGGAKYDFKITASDGTVEYVTEVEIASLDRSGYAHVGISGVGAYNNDGTLKSNAQVIYLTEANKNNVDGNGKSIAEYLANAKKITVTNKTPIVIRVVGTVGSATWNQIVYNNGKPITASAVKGMDGKTALPQEDLTQDELIAGGYNTLNLYPEKLGGAKCEPIRGLSSKALFSSGSFDSCWNDCKVQDAQNITVEGIGEDAEIFQWGFTFAKCNSIEVRNIRFFDYTEDACSFEGSSDDKTTLAGFQYKNFWVHHNIFDIGMNYWDICNEQDKHDGDGATDFKKLAYVTLAYNRYNGTHKTGLVGGGDTHYQAAFTFHHNYYNGCDQRMPLGRQANMHIYNNYFSKSGLYSVSLRAGAYAYIENCVFTSGKSSTHPIELDKADAGQPSVKVVDCQMQGTINNKTSANDADVIYNGDRAGVKDVTGGNKYGLNFDNNMPYTVTNKLETSKVVETIPKVAGTLKRDNNIKITGSTGGGDEGGDEGGNDDPTVEGMTFNVADAVNKGKLSIGEKQNINASLTDEIELITTGGNTKVNEYTKAFGEGLEFTHRVVLKNTGNYFKITVKANTTIRVYVANASSTDTTGRQLGLYTSTSGTTAVDGTTVYRLLGGKTAIADFTVAEAGTYYLESIDNELSIFAIDLIEADDGGNTGGDSGNTGDDGGNNDSYQNVSVKIEDIVKTDANPDGILDLSSGSDNAAYDLSIADGISLKMSGKVNAQSKTIDGVKFSYRVVLKNAGNYFEIVTKASCTVKIYVANSGSTERLLGLYSDTEAENAVETTKISSSTNVVVEFKVGAGTYYLESLTNELGIFAIEIIYS